LTRLQHIIFNRTPLKHFIRWSKKTTLPGFEGVPLYDSLRYFFKEIYSSNLNERTAAIAFSFLLAIPPVLLFLFTLVPYLPLKNAEPTIYSIIRIVAPNYNTYMLVKNIVYDFLHTERTGLLSLGLLFSLFYASNGMMGLMRAFDKINPVFIKRNGWQRRKTAIKLTLMMILVIILAIGIFVFPRIVVGAVSDYIGMSKQTGKLIVNLVGWLIIISMLYVTIGMTYHYGPATTRRLRFSSPGTIMATFSVIVVTTGFFYMANNFIHYNKIYGSIGTVMVLMVCIHLNARILLLGFELNTSILVNNALRKKETDEDEDNG
jgi:membrane protein